MGEQTLELLSWKKDLELEKQQNLLELKMIEQSITQLNERLNVLKDISDKLKSDIIQEIDQQLEQLKVEKENLKKKNTDIGTIIFTIDSELGNVIVFD